MFETKNNKRISRVLISALALPAAMTGHAHAESAPERGKIAVNAGQLHERQPDASRVKVNTKVASLLAPLGASWSLEAMAAKDDISGALPRNYTDMSDTYSVDDRRTRLNGKVTYFLDGNAYGVSLASAKKNDLASSTMGVDVRVSSENEYDTLGVGLDITKDKLDSSNLVAVNEHRRTMAWRAGVTERVSETDFLKFDFHLSLSKGYLNDPYKAQDVRPDRLNQVALQALWQSRFDEWAGTLRSSYRYERDSWGVKAHTIGLEWAHELTDDWTVTPSVVYRTQSEAKFYVGPWVDGRTGLLFRPVLPAGSEQSTDQNLSAFGALTLGLRAAWKFDLDWTANFKGEYKMQRSDLRLIGEGSANIAPVNTHVFEIGLSRGF